MDDPQYGSSDRSTSTPSSSKAEPKAGPEIRLVAEIPNSTITNYQDTESQNSHDTKSGPDSFFTAVQWTADGSSLVATSSDKSIATFVIPDDLLQTSDPRPLVPQSLTKLPEQPRVVAPAPYFSLAEPATQTFLVACREHPLQLYHAFPTEGYSRPLCGYKLIKQETEAYITPSALVWDHSGTHFVCGSANRLDLFDVSRQGSDGPILTVPTIPSRRHVSKGGGVGMKGTVSSLATAPADANGSSIIAAGTWTRWVGLYDLYRENKTIANWSIAHAANEVSDVAIGGQGIAQTLWSPCGRYLVINERNANGLLLYDIRVTGQLLSILKGRGAGTQQRLHCDVFPSAEGGFEVWSGTQDGTVVVWDGVGLHSEYGMEPSWHWKAHQSPIGSTVVHSSGSVAATCSGGWEHPKTFESEDADEKHDVPRSQCSVLDESTLKIWSMTSPTQTKENTNNT
ncbi:unnamed protein product [Clonostachys rosea f. rosea IK726]|uniref:Anaphase-promoting complex subunit 4 WD40 domain-containing protein n=2 Tax=Bionectria ochroleuca TaxID=29856 RepID=A0A0B7JM83_BIOOC|nr:unnamed protein product [Clonostachys rosea f. rosea IK726]